MWSPLPVDGGMTEGPDVQSDSAQVIWGQTALMFVVLAIVLALLRAFTSQHYFMAAVTASYGFVIGWFAGWLARGREARR
jgi:hypothetical protein